MPPFAAISSVSWLPPASALPNTTTPMPPHVNAIHDDFGHNNRIQSYQISSLNPTDSNNVAYQENNANARDHFAADATYISASNVPNSYSNPVVLADSHSQPGRYDTS